MLQLTGPLCLFFEHMAISNIFSFSMQEFGLF